MKTCVINIILQKLLFLFTIVIIFSISTQLSAFDWDWVNSTHHLEKNWHLDSVQSFIQWTEILERLFDLFVALIRFVVSIYKYNLEFIDLIQFVLIVFFFRELNFKWCFHLNLKFHLLFGGIWGRNAILYVKLVFYKLVF
jgi:hypothetical protein